MSKEAIIEKIYSDAKIKSDSFVKDAEEKAKEILDEAKEQCASLVAQSKSETERMVYDILSRGQIVAELDAKKLQLSAKKEILDVVFVRALENVKELSDKEYLKLLLGMLEIAEDGDVITISKREEKVLTKKVVDEFAKKKGIKLSLSKTLGDFDGGLILTGNGIDKNLTLEVEIGMIRNEIETQIAKELFS